MGISSHSYQNATNPSCFIENYLDVKVMFDCRMSHTILIYQKTQLRAWSEEKKRVHYETQVTAVGQQLKSGI